MSTSVRAAAHAAVLVVLSACADVSAPFAPGSTDSATVTVLPSAVPTARAVSFTSTASSVAGARVLAAAGSIACGSAATSGAVPCQQAATAKLVSQMGPDAVLALGNNAFDNGTLSDYREFYAPTWGAFKNVTHPVPGDREYATTNAQGYFDYFNGVGVQSGLAGNRGKGWYSYDIDGWHVVALNSNCANVGGCGVGSPQEQWLRADLAASKAPCTIAYLQQGLFSSGAKGGNSAVRPLYDVLGQNDVDIVFSAGDYDYERFAPQTSAGVADATHGFRAFNVGVGGKQLRSWGVTQPQSAVRLNGSFGVVKLVMHAASYDWAFVPVTAGSATDSGTGTCNAARNNVAPTATISAPANGVSVTQGSSVTFTGSASDPEDGALSGASLVWTSSIDGQIGTGSTFVKALSPGAHIITLTATDAFGATSTASHNLTVSVVTPNQAPTGWIVTPANNFTAARGVAVLFSAAGSDPEDGALAGNAFTWTSSIDGNIGTGVSFSKSNLSVGTHVIAMTATDSKGATFTHNRTITITAAVAANQAPVASIAAPTNGASVVAGTSVTFTGSATDAESGALSGTALVWTSSRDGQIGTGASFTKSNLTVGTHTITLTAKDPQNAVASVTRTLTVTAAPAPANVAPVARYTFFCAQLACTFDGSSSSDDVGVTQYYWTWGDGTTTTSATAATSHAFATAGSRTVSLRVSDAAGLASTSSQTVVTTVPVTSSASAEPAGLRMIDDQPFDCMPLSSCGFSWALGQTYANAVAIVQDPTAPKSGANVAVQTFTSALPGGSSPATVELSFMGSQAVRTLYVSTWMKLSNNFQGHPTATNKLIHLCIDGMNKVFLEARGQGSGLLTPAFGLQGLQANYTADDGTGTMVTANSHNLMPNVTNTTVKRGQWQHYEIVAVANTVGVADGSLDLWLDGVHTLHYTGIEFIASGSPSRWDTVQWSPTWGGGGGTIVTPFTLSMDHMYLSGK